MFGLIVLVVGVVYLTLLVFVTHAAYQWAKRKGLSKSKCWLAGAGGFLLVYLPVFWDHVPTLIAHQYYCTTEAGFWVYKKPDQWKKENPGVAEILAYSASPRLWTKPADGSLVTDLNERFEDRRSYKHIKFIPVTIFTDVILDKASGELLAKHVTAGSRYGNPMTSPNLRSMKFWLNLGSCEGETLDLYKKYQSVRHAYEKIGEKK